MFGLLHSQRLKHNDRRSRFTSSGMQGVVEHGVLFHRSPENAAEQKKVPSVLKYWVIGYVYKKWYKLRNIKLQLGRLSFFKFFSLVISLLNRLTLLVWICIDILKTNYILITVEFAVSLYDPWWKGTFWLGPWAIRFCNTDRCYEDTPSICCFCEIFYKRRLFSLEWKPLFISAWATILGQLLGRWLKNKLKI